MLMLSEIFFHRDTGNSRPLGPAVAFCGQCSLQSGQEAAF